MPSLKKSLIVEQFQGNYLKPIHFSKTRLKTVEYFKLVHAHNPKLGTCLFFGVLWIFFFFCHCPFQTFCLPFSSPFSRSFLLLLVFYSCICRTNLANGTLISWRSNGTFYDHFCTKTDNVDFQLPTLQCHQTPKTTVVQIDLS